MADKLGLGIGEEATQGARSVLGRLAEFFHIFDLSFLVSGATTLAALLFLHYRLGFAEVFSTAGWIGGFALIIACYVCGLVSFALGRWVNGRLFRRRLLDRLLSAAIDMQVLQGQAVARFVSGGQPTGYPLWRLYIRLWQQLAVKHAGSPAFAHLSRYWAMAATYDGVAISLLVWAFVLAPWGLLGMPLLPWELACLAIAVLVGCAVLCLWQAARYYEFQIEDLVAALAVMGSRAD